MLTEAWPKGTGGATGRRTSSGKQPMSWPPAEAEQSVYPLIAAVIESRARGYGVPAPSCFMVAASSWGA